MGRQLIACLLAPLLLLQACGAGWHQPSAPSTAPLEPRQQVQVWQQTTMTRWHGVLLTPDSISGIPFRDALDCDSCRVAVPRSTVDSIRLGNPEAGFLKSTGLVLGLLLIPILLFCLSGMCADDYT